VRLVIVPNEEALLAALRITFNVMHNRRSISLVSN